MSVSASKPPVATDHARRHHRYAEPRKRLKGRSTEGGLYASSLGFGLHVRLSRRTWHATDRDGHDWRSAGRLRLQRGFPPLHPESAVKPMPNPYARPAGTS